MRKTKLVDLFAPIEKLEFQKHPPSFPASRTINHALLR